MVVDVADRDEWQEELSRALDGDREALGRLCEGYLKSKTYAYALTLLKNAQDAEDIVQSVFTWLVEHHGCIRKHSLESFEAFVMKMTKNACLDYLRKQKITEPIAPEHQIADVTGQDLTRHEIIAVLQIAIRELSAEDQELFTMRVLEEYSYQQIAEQTGIKLTTIFYRCRMMFKKFLENSDLRAYWEETIKGDNRS